MKRILFVFIPCICTVFSFAQNVGIGTFSPGSGLELKGPGLRSQLRITDSVSGNSLVLQGGPTSSMKVTGYNYTTSTAQPLYLSVDGANTIINSNGGFLGIGTATPGSGLELKGTGFASQQRITDASSGNSLVLQGGAGSNTKISAYNFTTSTANTLYISPDGGNTIINPTAGGVGIGRLVPTAGYLLDVGGPIKSVNDLSTHFVAQTTGGTNSWARYYMRSNAQSWFIGTSQNFNGNQLYIADETSNQARLTIQPNGGPISMQGNITQDLGGYGTPKAMIFLNGDATIIRCYNGINGSTSGGCGFTVGRVNPSGSYYIDFPFDISTRFFSISAENQCCFDSITYQFERFSNSRLRIFVFLSGTVTLADRPVMLLVY